MRKLFTFLLFGLVLSLCPALAQEIDESYVFVDENGTVIPDGTTIVRNVVESYDEYTEVINSGVSVKYSWLSNTILQPFRREMK